MRIGINQGVRRHATHRDYRDFDRLGFGLGIAGEPSAALAAAQDGNWSVLIITEKGSCDRGFRYSVNVSNGRVKYQGDAAVNLTGAVAPNGLIKVSIRVGDQGANGTGRLSASSGVGTWRGAGSWEAERR